MWKPNRGWTARTRTMRTIPPRPMSKKTSCVRYAYHHPDHQGAGVVFVDDQLGLGETPAEHLAALLQRVPNRWPRDGWILTMTVMCPHCGEERLIDQHRTYLVCQVCGKRTVFTGKADPSANPAAGRPA